MSKPERSELLFLVSRVIFFSFISYLLLEAGVSLVFCLVAQISLTLWYFHQKLSRRENSPHIRSLIDYVYLVVGALGILSAGLEYSYKDAENQRLTELRRVSVNADRVIEKYETVKNSVCPDPSYEQYCRNLREAADYAKNAQSMATQAALGMDFKDPDVPSYKFGELEEALRNVREKNKEHIETLLQNEMQDLEMAVGELASDYEYSLKHIGKPESSDNIFPTYFNLKFFGFALLASAVALRITRVTVEMRGWDKPRPLPKAR